MSSQLSGTCFENCTCEGPSPCTASSFQWPADEDFCDVMLPFYVESGEITAGRSRPLGGAARALPAGADDRRQLERPRGALRFLAVR
jgi:hypothetical protein